MQNIFPKCALRVIGFLVGFQLLVPWGLASPASSPPIRRFLKPLQLFAEVFQQDSSSRTLVDQLVEQDFRQTSFRLEALMRIYKDEYPESLKKYSKRVKKFEDVLGAYVDSGKRITFAKEVGAPTSALAYLRDQQKEVRDDFMNLLDEHEWLKKSGNLTSRMIEVIQNMEWASVKDDRKFVLSWFAEELQKTEETPFDLDELQDGIHEFRRQLRWFVLTAQALDGLLLKSDSKKCPIKEYATLPKQPIAKSKYAVLEPSPSEKNPCFISECLYLALVQTTKHFGLLKDLGEAKEMLAEALWESDLVDTEDEANLMAKKLVQKHPDYQEFLSFYPGEKTVFKKAKAIAREFKRTRLLKVLRAEVNACVP